ncbi:MAG: hypothetical protein CVU38_08135 [Chloroflexi bacterium HGW-Chloroflexi-1]|nr:MAG: hypothetical protein CVU38_08135 [Chloroflexi bacterium HGW-Chloroflexi-1]
MERRALEAAFGELAEITETDRQAQQAAEIARHGDAALPVLVALLNTADPQLRGGLGQVAMQLDRRQVVTTLRGVARSHTSSDQARLTALTILDRFLQEPVDEALLTGLSDSDAVARQSLSELTHAMANDPFSVIEYLNQLAEQPPEVPGMILAALPQMPPDPHLVTLLRMFAQGADPRVARNALDQLSRTRTVEAAVALASLTVTLPPHLAPLAERGLRKLRLSGVPAPTPGAVQWHVLLSPVDGAGAQLAWFVGTPDGDSPGRLLSILIRDPEGIVACFGSTAMSDAELPPLPAPDHPYTIPQPGDTPPITFLQVPFEVGYQAVQEALAWHWDAGTVPPLEYRLLNPLIWTNGQTAGDPGATIEAVAYTPYQTAALLDHPAFTSWFWQAPALVDVAQQLGPRHDPAVRAARIAELAGAHFGPAVVASYQRRLHRMSTWLSLAAQPEAAALAAAAAEGLAGGPPETSPFLLRLIGIGLDIAFISAFSATDLQRSA